MLTAIYLLIVWLSSVISVDYNILAATVIIDIISILIMGYVAIKTKQYECRGYKK
jgi:hypothetical protein